MGNVIEFAVREFFENVFYDSDLSTKWFILLFLFIITYGVKSVKWLGLGFDRMRWARAKNKKYLNADYFDDDKMYSGEILSRVGIIILYICPILFVVIELVSFLVLRNLWLFLVEGGVFCLGMTFYYVGMDRLPKNGSASSFRKAVTTILALLIFVFVLVVGFYGDSSNE